MKIQKDEIKYKKRQELEFLRSEIIKQSIETIRHYNSEFYMRNIDQIFKLQIELQEVRTWVKFIDNQIINVLRS